MTVTSTYDRPRSIRLLRIVAKSSLFNNKNIRPFLTKCHTAPAPDMIYDSPDNDLEKRLDMIDTGNLELLLCMETRARMDNQEKREKEQQLKKEEEAAAAAAAAAAATPRRPTKIKFELPVTPPRSKSPIKAYPKAKPVRSLPEEGLTANALRRPPPSPKPRRSSWRYLFGDRDNDDDMPLPITLGSRVRLTMRPLPTFGYVQFIGAVEFGHGEWIGVELDHGVGNCDGSVDGITYFDTDPNRGIFCKRRELEAVAE
ncbi:CAP Gly-rich domain-containing protein [Mycotypha africana]|uniref:CAP Gly-rich domain-containing protein n=1 Tax=Mycotypha africana TaxID=64632 RepID=UPI00230153BE|nr:CAP Gly-rich domain-containing protein [Mycotypha africana]KAI8968349.1 CAP Gly-rich domain-containing protein [Mycotypha africana]